ncbi:unnamed protein product [Schistosoma mattheei]|uniref:Uncharacterized protein n=1 Tax=Schistosoma mattheei TaxID=31246 RepID=A0AA85B096_9TREM|nr:unnamed protein product [Schistosoma mattheei]
MKLHFTSRDITVTHSNLIGIWENSIFNGNMGKDDDHHSGSKDHKKDKPHSSKDKKKTTIVIINRVQNIVLGHRLLHHRTPIIKRSKSHGINENETFFTIFIISYFLIKVNYY